MVREVGLKIIYARRRFFNPSTPKAPMASRAREAGSGTGEALLLPSITALAAVVILPPPVLRL